MVFLHNKYFANYNLKAFEVAECGFIHQSLKIVMIDMFNYVTGVFIT